MLEKIKISLLVWFGFLPTYILYNLCHSFSFEAIFGYFFYLIIILFVFFMIAFGKHSGKTKFSTYLYSSAAVFFIALNLGIYLYFNHQHNSGNLFVVENERHQIKFKKNGSCVLRETCCHNKKYSYIYGEYELIGDTILLDGEVLNRKKFNKLSIKGKEVKLVSEDEKRNDYFTLTIIEDNRKIDQNKKINSSSNYHK